jgi:hypothetical protein
MIFLRIDNGYASMPSLIDVAWNVRKFSKKRYRKGQDALNGYIANRLSIKTYRSAQTTLRPNRLAKQILF